MFQGNCVLYRGPGATRHYVGSWASTVGIPHDWLISIRMKMMLGRMRHFRKLSRKSLLVRFRAQDMLSPQ